MDDHLTILGQLNERPHLMKDAGGGEPMAYLPVRLERIELGNNSTFVGLTIGRQRAELQAPQEGQLGRVLRTAQLRSLAARRADRGLTSIRGSRPAGRS
jgi:hypothetical protein